MTRRIQSDNDIAEGIAYLLRAEPRFAQIVEQAGPVPLRRADAGFAGLSRTIVSQQLSVASARAIWNRVSERFPVLCHADIRGASEADLRGCGLSGPKIRTLRAIADAAAEGRLDFEALETASPEDVHAMMTAVSGIGPWTADIYLMFHLGHADVFAAGDLALQEAVRIGFALAERPTARQLATQAEAWSPWRAVAARILWAYYNTAKTREGIAV
jgi:DNA-3-methyladenine glycosylase II